MAPKLDNGWEHATPVGGDRKKCKCNNCGKVVYGGITHLKQHIAHVSRNVEACSRVPSEIRKMEDRLYGDIPNINVDSSDEDNDGIDEYGMSSLERKQFKQAMAESRYMGHVEDELRRNPSRGHYGGSSKGSTSGAKRGISQSYGVKSGVEMPSTGFDPHMFPSSKKTIKGMLSKKGTKKVGKAMSKFFICNALPFNAADSGPYMQSMIDTIAEVGPGVKWPSGYQIGVMEPLVRVLKAVDQDKKPTLCIIYEAMDRAKMTKKQVLESGRNTGRLLMTDDIGSCIGTCMQQIRLFVDKLGEFGSPLARQAISTSLPAEKLHKLVYAHYNMRLREFTREAEEPLLSENDLDWLDEAGRMDNIPNDEDDDTLLPLSHCRQNDGDEETAEDDDNDDDDDDDDDNDDNDDNNGDNDGDGNVHKETQQNHGMT
ncbi:UNVERIFIED_CONTAM: hypothetical protein Scaly_0584400 [Sesamum calycinum]|uniref:BED-type domain-containing protein n=1 Tax=Sesamum calycinum TaxID=2727403 RepID=A0AAW2RS17_9LAMI